MKFIYVFTEQDKSNLLSRGYKLLKEDVANGVFIFANETPDELDNKVYSSLDKYCLSNVLTF